MVLNLDVFGKHKQKIILVNTQALLFHISVKMLEHLNIEHFSMLIFCLRLQLGFIILIKNSRVLIQSSATVLSPQTSHNPILGQRDNWVAHNSQTLFTAQAKIKWQMQACKISFVNKHFKSGQWLYSLYV